MEKGLYRLPAREFERRSTARTLLDGVFGSALRAEGDGSSAGTADSVVVLDGAAMGGMVAGLRDVVDSVGSVVGRPGNGPGP